MVIPVGHVVGGKGGYESAPFLPHTTNDYACMKEVISFEKKIKRQKACNCEIYAAVETKPQSGSSVCL